MNSNKNTLWEGEGGGVGESKTIANLFSITYFVQKSRGR